MVQSMTGYASSIIEIPIKADEKLSLSVSIKSLNSRYFEANCKLPYLLNNLEVTIQRSLKQKLHRGHVYLSVKVNLDTLQHDVVPSIATVKGYLHAINSIKKECNIAGDVTIDNILKLPNILQVEEEALNKKTEKLILDSISKVIDQLVATRITEGKALVKDVKQQVAAISKKFTLIKKASIKAAKQKKDDLDTIISKLQSFSEEEMCTTKCMLENQKSNLISELEKIDINEEIVRAGAHLKAILSWATARQDTKGKKLDFILQELNREINTIASKCSNFTISSLAIDVKSELEKCREQAQNIV